MHGLLGKISTLKRGMILVGLLLIAAVTIVACGGEAEESSGSSSGVKTGGILKVGMLSDHVTFDTPNVLGMPDIVTIIQTQDVLVFRQADLELRPALATSWSFNEDASSWTFNLREGVHFYSYENGAVVEGKEFTADDVIFTINRMYDMESPTAGTIFPEKFPMVKIDDHTVRFDFGTPNATLLDGLVKYHSHMTPSNVDPATFAAGTPGTGLGFLRKSMERVLS